MQTRNPGEQLQHPLLNKLSSLIIIGGQYSDGSQKDGILRYEKGQPVAVYDIDKRAYVSFSSLAPAADEKLGPLPGPALPWKEVIKQTDRPKTLECFFANLKTMDTLGARLAFRYGSQCRKIGLKQVTDNVAMNADDVNTVLRTGFFHCYGPINNYFI